MAIFYVDDVPGFCELQPSAGSGETWCGAATCCSDGEPKTERLASKLESAELAWKFKDALERATVPHTAPFGDG